MDTKVDHRTFTGFHHFVFHLLSYLRHDFFDAGRMDTSVLYQLVQSQAGNLAANRIEAGQHDCFRRIVYHDFNTGSCFQRPDVTPFTADDAAFDFIGFDMKYGNRVLDRRFGSNALDRLDNDLFRFLVGCHLSFFHDLVNEGSGFGLGLVFQ